MSLVFWDIETDGLESTKMWVAVIKPRGGESIVTNCAQEAVEILNRFDAVVGHNIIGFDKPQLEKLSGLKITGKLIDTLLISRILFPDKFNHPAKGNGLGNWGTYLGFPKGDHSDWSCYSPEMRDYCIQDVAVTERLYDHLLPMCKHASQAIKLEHDVARIIKTQIILLKTKI